MKTETYVADAASKCNAEGWERGDVLLVEQSMATGVVVITAIGTEHVLGRECHGSKLLPECLWHLSLWPTTKIGSVKLPSPPTRGDIRRIGDAIRRMKPRQSAGKGE